MINRRITRVVLNSTEVTASAASIQSDTIAAALTTSDVLYLGFHGRFSTRYFQVGTVNTNTSAISIYYNDGTDWVAVDDAMDQTSVGGKTLAQSGFISWDNKSDWQATALTGVDSDILLYWIKITVSANLSAGTTIQSIVNLFSDDTLLRAYYPELISDANYLPASRTNFLEQHVAAKDICVLRLKQRHVINDESQVIDINAVSVAAVHACAFLILNPIATSEAAKELKDNAQKLFESEIGMTTISTDANSDGVVSTAERQSVMSTQIYRR